MNQNDSVATDNIKTHTLTIVSTIYKSQPYILEFYERSKKAATGLFREINFIFVNDGSPDDSISLLREIALKDSSVTVIDFARNFGHHRAIMSGLEYATGELVFLIDIDLEEPPEVLEEFFSKFRFDDCDVVYGVQASRKGNIFERFTGEIFYNLFNLLSFYPVPKNFVTARLMSRRYVKSLLLHKERELFLGGLWSITGFKQVPVLIKKSQSSPSTYTIDKKISLFVNSITSFSDKPLKCIFYIGTLIIFIATLAALSLLFYRLFIAEFQMGWASLIISIWFLSGMIIFCLGIIGIYLAKVFVETKQRPYSIIKDIYNLPAKNE